MSFVPYLLTKGKTAQKHPKKISFRAELPNEINADISEKKNWERHLRKTGGGGGGGMFGENSTSARVGAVASKNREKAANAWGGAASSEKITRGNVDDLAQSCNND